MKVKPKFYLPHSIIDAISSAVNKENYSHKKFHRDINGSHPVENN